MRLRSAAVFGGVSFGFGLVLANCSAGGSGNTGGYGAGSANGGAGGHAATTGVGQGGNNNPSISLVVPTSGPTPTKPDDPDPTNPNITHPTCGAGTCTDFPTAPIIDDAHVPANAATLFGAATNFTTGLCLLEPQLSASGVDGAMMPANWVRPRFHIAVPKGSGLDLFEIRLSSPAEANDLVVYTSATDYYLPADIWSGKPVDGGTASASGSGFANNAAGQPVTVTVRAVSTASPGKPVGVTGTFNIAPVVVTGAMVFWTVNSSAVTATSSKLLGFAVGDEGVAESLTLPQVTWSGQIGEDGTVLRGYYDNPPNPNFSLGQVRCIGCHTSTPDGTAVVFTDDWPWSKAVASLTSGSAGTIPSFISAGAQGILKMPWWGTQAVTKAHWATGDRILVTSYGSTYADGTLRSKPWQGLQGSTYNIKIKWHSLAWIDLEYPGAIDVTAPATPQQNTDYSNRETQAAAAQGTGWGIIGTGDTGVSDVSPAFNHKGDTIVYTTTDLSPDGHPDYLATTADIRTVPYGNKLGGTSKALAGASSPSYLEYYPSYSPDDAFIIFTRAPAPSTTSPDGPYYNRNGEIQVIPAAGGTPTRLVASDAPACAGNPAGGLLNSWPKWAPDAVVHKGSDKTYYFVIFSSARVYGDEFSQQFQLPANTASNFTGVRSSSQLYLAGIVVDNKTGAITTYPAVYVWNQNRTPTSNTNYSNLTPAWDAFKLPPLTIPPVQNTTINIH